MRIALVTRRFPPLIGGAERVLGYLAPALAEEGEGHEVVVLTSAIGAAAREPREQAVPTRRGALVVRRLGTSPLRFVGTLLYLRNLARALEDFRPDVAYVSMLKHDGYAVVGVSERRGFPVVLRPEGAGATGDLAWQDRGRFGRRIGARCRRADALVAISRPIREELLRAGYEASRLVDLPNGVPVPDRPWNRRPGWAEAPRAAFVGRLAPEKGLDTLVDAWPRVRAVHPGAVLTLVGEGPERPALEARIARLGLGDAVRPAGASADVAGHLRDSDLFVLPSREEGMSVALLEAMALGIPLVASAIPGNRRLVCDFKHGRLARPDDPEALARAVLDQWANLDRALHMGRSARALVAQKYSIAAVARGHMTLFRKLVAEGKGPAC